MDQDPSNKEKAATKRVYIEAYKYLGYYNYLQTTNPAKKNEAIAATKDYWNKMLELVAMKRYGNPEEVASVISFLCSEDASYVTGQTIEISGGLMM